MSIFQLPAKKAAPYGKEFMFQDDATPSNPLSLTIPGGPYCPRRPTLREILADESSPPWTLSSFTQYLSQKHCLETLEFTIDASRYGKHYQAIIDRDPQILSSPQTPDCIYVWMLWQKLLDAYIVQDSSREVNLPSEVRDKLVSLPYTFAPPHPSHLDQAIRFVYDLMSESILVPFLSSTVPLDGVSELYSDPCTPEHLIIIDRDERSLSFPQSREQDQMPTGAGPDGFPSRQLQQDLSPPATRHSRFSASLSSSASGSGSGSSFMVDGIESPSNDIDNLSMASAVELVTLSTTLLQSDIGLIGFLPTSSPPNSRNKGTGRWKKMGNKLGWKKGESSHSLASNTGFWKYPVDKSGYSSP